MPRKSTKKTLKPVRPQLGDGVEILNAGSVLEDPITRTLETNYMPYAMSVIVSRALPEIDGFKPAHRKLLYTMYEMGLIKGARTKSANIVGSTMHLNPHGDAAIYDTMVRMGRGNESLLMPFVDSKGNFGKAYSRDMSCAAARYTEARMSKVAAAMLADIEKDTVDFVPNYDETEKEPVVLPARIPNLLVNGSSGIAVGMATNIPPHNLGEVIDGLTVMIDNKINGKETDVEELMEYIKAHAVQYRLPEKKGKEGRDRIIGLSTCSNDQTNGRVILYGFLYDVDR